MPIFFARNLVGMFGVSMVSFDEIASDLGDLRAISYQDDMKFSHHNLGMVPLSVSHWSWVKSYLWSNPAWSKRKCMLVNSSFARDN